MSGFKVRFNPDPDVRTNRKVNDETEHTKRRSGFRSKYARAYTCGCAIECCVKAYSLSVVLINRLLSICFSAWTLLLVTLERTPHSAKNTIYVPFTDQRSCIQNYRTRMRWFLKRPHRILENTEPLYSSWIDLTQIIVYHTYMRWILKGIHRKMQHIEFICSSWKWSLSQRSRTIVTMWKRGQRRQPQIQQKYLSLNNLPRSMYGQEWTVPVVFHPV